MTAQAAANMLDEARRTGRRIAALPEHLRPETLAGGYDIQDRLVERIGSPVAGWKLGVGSARARSRSGVGRAIAGRIPADRVYRPDGVVRLLDRTPVTIEFEIAFLLCRDVLPNDPVTDARSLVGEIRVAFEIVRSRFVDRRAVGWPSFAADNAAFEALVLGEAVAAEEVPQIARTLVVEVDGVERARAAGGDDETVPLQSLADLVAIARERDMPLPKGSIVSTGTLSVPFDASPAASVTARYCGRWLTFSLDAP